MDTDIAFLPVAWLCRTLRLLMWNIRTGSVKIHWQWMKTGISAGKLTNILELTLFVTLSWAKWGEVVLPSELQTDPSSAPSASDTEPEQHHSHCYTSHRWFHLFHCSTTQTIKDRRQTTGDFLWARQNQNMMTAVRLLTRASASGSEHV